MLQQSFFTLEKFFTAAERAGSGITLFFLISASLFFSLIPYNVL
jgi:hypothetical protein